MSGIHNNTLKLDYLSISRWQKGKTTEQEVKSQLGVPTIIDSDGKHTQWYYENNKARLSIQFNVDHTVSGFQYSAANLDVPRKVEAEQLKSLVAGTTDIDLVRLFGEPTYVNMSASGKEISYRDLLTHSTLQAMINEHIGLITDFRFFEKGLKQSFIDIEKVMNINKGQTTSTDIVNLFGRPTMKTIEKTKESWCYESDNALLTIDFNQDNKIVSAYQSKQR
ncbi:hypothetical protein GCM10028818_59330 [Spirosoma horti]